MNTLEGYKVIGPDGKEYKLIPIDFNLSAAPILPADCVLDPQKPIGDQLRKARENRGLSVRELARRTGMSYVSLSKIERNKFKKKPQQSTLRILLMEMGKVPHKPTPPAVTQS